MKLVNNKMNKLRSHLQDVRADAVQKGNKVAAKPPRAAGRKKSKQKSEWDDGHVVVNEIPQYKVAEDKFAQGYIAGLARQRRLKPYLNMVYVGEGKHISGYVVPSSKLKVKKLRDESSETVSRKKIDIDGSSVNQSEPKRSNSNKERRGRNSSVQNTDSVDNTGELIEVTQTIKASYENMKALWDKFKVPSQHRINFIEQVRQLDLAQIHQVLAQEAEDLQKGIAPIFKVIDVIKHREQCLLDIEAVTVKYATDKPSEQVIDELQGDLMLLRTLSIRTVELIVLWRDQFRYLSLMSTNLKLARKRRAQQAIQVPYIIDPKTPDGQFENYLLKMKHDTKWIAENLLIGNHFNTSQKVSDTFLIQMSIKGSIVAGADFRALKANRNSSVDKSGSKRVLLMKPEEMQKAKACDEMIHFEKSENIARQPISATSSPNLKIITDFESNIEKYLNSLTTQISIVQQTDRNMAPQITDRAGGAIETDLTVTFNDIEAKTEDQLPSKPSEQQPAVTEVDRLKLENDRLEIAKSVAQAEKIRLAKEHKEKAAADLQQEKRQKAAAEAEKTIKMQKEKQELAAFDRAAQKQKQEQAAADREKVRQEQAAADRAAQKEKQDQLAEKFKKEKIASEKAKSDREKQIADKKKLDQDKKREVDQKKLVKQKSDVKSDEISEKTETKKVVTTEALVAVEAVFTTEHQTKSEKEIFLQAAADFEKAHLDKSVESSNFRSEVTAKPTQIAKPQENPVSQETSLYATQPSQVVPALKIDSLKYTAKESDVKGKMKLSAIDIDYSELINYVDEYYARIPNAMAKSNHECDIAVNKTEDGYQRHYFHIVVGDVVHGLACLNYDHTLLGGHRVYIRHLSTIMSGELSQALDLVCDFIWQEIPCDNIRVELYHFKDDETGKINVDNDIKSAYAGKGFRWKTLTNDPATGKRAQIMELKNPNGNQANIQEPYSVKLALTIDQDPQQLPKPGPTACKIISPISLISLGLYPDIQLKENLIATKTFTTDIQQVLTDQQINMQAGRTNLASVTSLVGRFPVFDFIQHNGTCYLRIKKDIVFAASGGKSVYIIQTDDVRLKFLVIPLTAKPEDPLALAQSVLAGLEDQDGCFKTELLIPSFNVEVQQSDQLTGTQSGTNSYVKSNKFYGQVKLASGKAPVASIVRPLGRQSEVIESDFLFVLIDGESEEKAEGSQQMPPMLVVHVTRDCFIRY